ncbi:MAG: hypothetical protein ACRD21_09250 [Vicinamibacteria bacterium]
MMHVDVLHPSTSSAQAVYLEAEDGGVNPKTRVRALLRDRNGVRETSLVFDTLEEALAYAQTLYPPAA